MNNNKPQKSFEEMSFEEIREIYVNDPGVRFGTMAAFKHFEKMDPVKALDDIESLHFILKKRLKGLI